MPNLSKDQAFILRAACRIKTYPEHLSFGPHYMLIGVSGKMIESARRLELRGLLRHMEDQPDRTIFIGTDAGARMMGMQTLQEFADEAARARSLVGVVAGLTDTDEFED